MTQQMQQRIPQAREAEEAVIGGLLFQARALAEVAPVLAPQDFYHPALKAIYEAILELDGQSQAIDIITVAEQMRKTGTLGKLKAHGGESYLAALSSRVATVENIGYHAEMVRQKSVVRQLAEAGARITGRCMRDDVDASVLLDEAQQAIFGVANRSTTQSYEMLRGALHMSIKALERRHQRKEAITGIPSGYTRLDEMTAGFQPGDLIIIAARPSMGKTAFAMNCAQHAALEHGVPVLVFSLEMATGGLVDRMICSEARVDAQRMRAGLLEARDWINVTKATSRMSDARVAIDDTASPTLMEIRSKARRWRSDPRFAASKHPGLIVVDYLQLIAPSAGRREVNREREISEISRGLKALAKELGVPVVALSQLNRSVESRADKRPMTSDLRESGAIEQDADLICFIYRDEVYNKESPDKGVAEIIIGKQRNGPTGTVRLAFLNQYTRFENLAGDRIDERHHRRAA